MTAALKTGARTALSARSEKPLPRADKAVRAPDGNGLPKSWQLRVLSDIATLQRGKFDHRPRNEPRFYGGSIPFVQTGDVTKSGGRIRTYTQTLNELGLTISKTFPAGAILITIAANIGYSGILEFESACPDSLVGIIPGHDVDTEFLQFYLVTQQPEMDRLAPRGTQKNINIQFLRPWPVALPPLAEQRKIAGVLGLVQRAMEQQERLLALTAELKKALLHQLFTHGLPRRSLGEGGPPRHEPQKQTELGLVPESWEVSKIGDVAKTQSGGTPARDKAQFWKDGTIPWVKTGEIDYCVIDKTEEHITAAGLADSAAQLFPKGTLLMAMYGQGVTRGRVAMLGIDATTNQACAAITPHSEDQVSSRFLYYYLEYHYENLRKLGHGANQRNMNAALIRSFPLAFPRRDEQSEVVTALASVDSKRALHRRKHTALSALFRTLLHELMTARLRVHNLELDGILSQPVTEIEAT